MTKFLRPALIAVLFATGFCWAGPDSKNGKSDEQIRQEKKEAIDDLFGGREYRSRDGKKEAEADIASGKPKYKTYGRQLAPQYEAARDKVFFDRFGVQHEGIAGCMVSESVVAYAKAYNARILSFVAERFGPNAWAEAEKEAYRQIEAVRQAKNAKKISGN